VLQVSLWTRLITLIILVGGILIALPNALSPDVRARIPKFLPSSAVNLGLDLQGGSYLLLGVDFDAVTRDRVESLVGDIRASFRKARIPFTVLPSPRTRCRCMSPTPAGWRKRAPCCRAPIPA